MDHNEERQEHNKQHWFHCQQNIVNYLIEVWKLDVSAEEVNHVIGLIEVNAFEVKLICSEYNENNIIELGLP